MSELRVTIDRIILTGLDIPAAQTERFRALVEAELGRRLLAVEGWRDGITGRNVDNLALPPMYLGEHNADGLRVADLAQNIAGHLARGLQSLQSNPAEGEGQSHA